MPIGLRLPQNPKDIVSLQEWEPDNEFPVGPQGAKPKRIFVCPTPAPHPFLVGGHRYLFKEPDGTYAQQIWSEVIAYELSRDLRTPVPPAFVARAPRNGSPGVLVEFFYGYLDMPDQRFVHAIELLQGIGRAVNFRRGSLWDNVTLCRLCSVIGWREWWARTLALDSIIGNTDRHSENWGFLTQRDRSSTVYSLAPAFDNGTSLGYIIQERQLVAFTDSRQLHRFIDRGRHHFNWVTGDSEGAQHARLCRKFRDRMKPPWGAMGDALNLSDRRIDQIVDWCASFEFDVPFSPDRARFVAKLLKARRNVLAAALGA